MIVVASCTRVEPIYNVEDDTVPADVQHKLSSEQVGKIIANAALEKGWTVRHGKPGHMQCTLKWRDHSATVDIAYSKNSYNIELDSSENLLQENGMIHKRYNEYVQQLQNKIDEKLSQADYN
jgi:hypothetical protein